MASNRTETLDRVRLTFDAEARSTFEIDLAAVAVGGSHAWAIDVKRGGGSTNGTRRAQVERELLAPKLLLRSSFRQQGFLVDDVSVAVIDVYGGGGFGPGLTVTRQGIDGFFGIPVIDVIDALEDRLRRRLDAAWTGLATSMSKSRDTTASPRPEPDQGDDADDTPVASTRSRWTEVFAVGARRAPSRPRPASVMPLVAVEPRLCVGDAPAAA